MEAGNVKAMLEFSKFTEEALDAVNKIYDLISKPCVVREEVFQACQQARAILYNPPITKTPPRNCDVGTAEEQGKRFKKFCNDHQAPWHGCTNCPVLMSEKCAIAWAQMPYKEGDK